MTGNELINTKFAPPYQAQLMAEARRARAYYMMCPYPSFGFRDWVTEKEGPLPQCLPIARHVVQKSARWLFGDPLNFTVNGNQEEEDRKKANRIEQIWALSGMHNRILSIASNAGQTSGYVLKYSYDKNAAKEGFEPIRIDAFDAAEQCQLFYDPMDCNKVLMLRIQYPFYDAKEGGWFMHREEWTDSLHVSFKPLRIQADPETRLDIMGAWNTYTTERMFESWTEEGRKANAFKRIPAQLVKNLDIGAEYGWGDYWAFYGVLDRLNFSADLMHKGNQLTAFPKEVRINATVQDDDDGEPLAPNEPEYLVPINKDLPIDVKILESHPEGRTHLQVYFEMLRTLFYDAVGSVLLDPATITGKGAMSSNVMRLIHQPLIELTKEKQVCQGEGGISPFFQNMALGLAAAGINDELASSEPIDVTVHFTDFFDLTEDEKLTRTTRLIAENDAMLKSKARVIQEMAAADGAVDAAEMIAEVEEMEDEPQPAAEDKGGEDPNGPRNNRTNRNPGTGRSTGDEDGTEIEDED